jgi:D-glycero-D-manno-heptose 1,7-bisphosphate phosphatase
MTDLFPCLFLDRDGTINVEKEYISDPDDFVLIPGTAQAIAYTHHFGMKVVVVSNQSGVARGYLTENDVIRVNRRLDELLKAAGTYVDSIYYCPHYPENNTKCTCRKPGTGMFERAALEHFIDLKRSIMVGDRKSDMEAGRNIGAATMLVLTGYGKTFAGTWNSVPPEIDHIADSLYDGLDFIERKSEEWTSKLKGEH